MNKMTIWVALLLLLSFSGNIALIADKILAALIHSYPSLATKEFPSIRTLFPGRGGMIIYIIVNLNIQYTFWVPDKGLSLLTSLDNTADDIDAMNIDQIS